MPCQQMFFFKHNAAYEIKVGSLGASQHKLKMANDPEYRAEVAEEVRRPTTLREVLGMAPGLTMRQAFAQPA